APDPYTHDPQPHTATTTPFLDSMPMPLTVDPTWYFITFLQICCLLVVHVFDTPSHPFHSSSARNEGVSCRKRTSTSSLEKLPGNLQRRSG
ncbi:hypothetical protein PENTCL1PPCAC_11775, partial [Pristionchus entomophagus]